MPVKESLHQLIQLLSPDEREFFVKYHNSNSKAILRLFHDLENTDPGGIDALKEKYKSYRSLSSKLKKSILHTMRVFRLEKGVDNRIHCLQEDSRFYYEKGFLDQATKSIQEAKRFALKHDRTWLAIGILTEEIRLVAEQKTGDLQATVLKLIHERDELIRGLKTELDAMDTYYRYFLAYRAGESLGDTADFPFSAPFDRPSSTTARIYSHYANSFYGRMISGAKEARTHMLLALEEWESNEALRKSEQGRYRRHLGNYAMTCLELHLPEEAEAAISKVKAMPSINFNEDAERFQTLILYRLVFALRFYLKPSDSLESISKAFEKGFRKYESKINPARKVVFWFNMCLLCIWEQEFKRAKKWLDMIMVQTRFKIRKDVIHAARLLRMLVYFELKDFEELDNIVSANYVFYHRAKLLDEFSRSIFSFFKKVLKSRPEEFRGHFASLNSDLLKLRQQGFKEKATVLHFFLEWTKANLTS